MHVVRRFAGTVVAVFVSVLVFVGAAIAEVEGEAFPSISLPDVTSGETLNVGEAFTGKVGALVFMQTSCAACRKELFALRDISEKVEGLQIVAVSVDAGKASRVGRYKSHFKFSFPFVHDPDFTTPGLFDFAFTPALVLVDKKGKIAKLKGGFRPKEAADLEVWIKDLLAAE